MRNEGSQPLELSILHGVIMIFIRVLYHKHDYHSNDYYRLNPSHLALNPSIWGNLCMLGRNRAAASKRLEFIIPHGVIMEFVRVRYHKHDYHSNDYHRLNPSHPALNPSIWGISACSAETTKEVVGP